MDTAAPSEALRVKDYLKFPVRCFMISTGQRQGKAVHRDIQEPGELPPDARHKETGV